MEEEMSQELNDLRTSIDKTAKRNIAFFVIRWLIGFSLISAITFYNSSYMWLWYIAVPVALLSLAFTLLSKHFLTKKLNEASSVQETLDSLLVPEDDELKNLIVGTWILDTEHDGNHTKGETTYLDDGTFKSKVTIDSHGFKTSFNAGGNWYSDGKSITWTVTESTNTEIIPVGISQCEEILSINETSKTYKDPEGDIWTEQRTAFHV